MKQVANNTGADGVLTALETNVNAIQAIAGAVGGTIGPKGLDTMLVDQFGNVVITNDGLTILNLMEAQHPAAKMLINIARAQQEQVGDGTTTATLMASEMVYEGLKQVRRGVPVTRVIAGLREGTKKALDLMRKESFPIGDLDHPLLENIAFIAGRGYQDIASLVVQAAQIIGRDKIINSSFKFAERIQAIEKAENQVFLGMIINKRRINQQMPSAFDGRVKILVIDDALEPEEIEDEALTTEAGFSRYLQAREEFKFNLEKIIELGVQVVFVDRGVHSLAEEILGDAGIMVVSRIAHLELETLAEHTGSRMLKRGALNKTLDDLKKNIGLAEKVFEDEKLEHIKIIQGAAKPVATIIVSAATKEVIAERERIAKDAASAVQAAIIGGYVAGGGSLELALSREVEELQRNIKGMDSFGVQCVARALQRPFLQIVTNAGFNPLEKMSNIIQAQITKRNNSLAINCDTGEAANMLELGVLDPVLVKINALQSASEVAEAILRINTIIRKKDVGNISTEN